MVCPVKNQLLTHSLAALLLVGAMAFMTFGATTKGVAADQDWKKGSDKLAYRKVELLSEQDEAHPSHKERLQKLVFEVRSAPVNLKDVKVQLVTGAFLDIPIRAIVMEVSRSAVIDLPGEARTVKKIVFSYESLKSKRAEVVIWGKKH
jgi:hypothetical protein